MSRRKRCMKLGVHLQKERGRCNQEEKFCQKTSCIVTMETAVLLARGRAQLRSLLGRILYKYEFCKIGSFHRCRLHMTGDYNPQLSIHIFQTNRKSVGVNYPEVNITYLFTFFCLFVFLLVLLFSCLHCYEDHPFPLERGIFFFFNFSPSSCDIHDLASLFKAFYFKSFFFFLSPLQFVQLHFYGSNFMDQNLPLGVTEYM